jgi:hypothetical protein
MKKPGIPEAGEPGMDLCEVDMPQKCPVFPATRTWRVRNCIRNRAVKTGYRYGQPRSRTGTGV